MMDIPWSDIDILDHEVTIRLACFGLIFLIMALMEWGAPRRQRTDDKSKRWFANIGILVVGNSLIRVAIPIIPVAIAITADENGWGLLNSFQTPLILKIIATILVMDLIIFFQHMVFHHITVLWSVHRVHHSDLDLDVTSALRFHPLEMVISLGIKLTVVIALGLPAVGVLIFEVILNGMAMFNHANVKIPLKTDAVLRKFVVTPDMHRVHHSVIHRENRSNFGFNLSIWDHIFRTYIDQPEKGHGSMEIGLMSIRDPSYMTLPRLLFLPFRSIVPENEQTTTGKS